MGKHLAVEHSVVMAFVRRDVGVRKGSAQYSPIKRDRQKVGADSPQCRLGLQTPGLSKLANGNPGSISVSVVQINDNNGDSKHNGARERRRTVTPRNIRTVLGDDSDSDSD